MAEIGQNVSYTFTANNTGSANVTNVSFKLTFMGLNFVSLISVSAGVYDQVNHIWELPRVLVVAGSENLNLELEITADNYSVSVTEVTPIVPEQPVSAESSNTTDSATPVTQSEATTQINSAITDALGTNYFVSHLTGVDGTEVQMRTGVTYAKIAAIGTDGLIFQNADWSLNLGDDQVLFDNGGTNTYMIRLQASGILDVRRTVGTALGEFTIIVMWL